MKLHDPNYGNKICPDPYPDKISPKEPKESPIEIEMNSLTSKCNELSDIVSKLEEMLSPVLLEKTSDDKSTGDPLLNNCQLIQRLGFLNYSIDKATKSLKNITNRLQIW